MDTKKKIGTRINSALLLRGKKQKELAEVLGVTANTVSYFCSGSRTPNIEQIIMISNYLNTTTDYLLGRTDDPNIVPAASDELGLSPAVIQWIKDTPAQLHMAPNVTHELNSLLENHLFQRLCVSLIEYKYAVLADGIEAQISAYCDRRDPDCADPDLLLDLLLRASNSEKHPMHVKSFLRAKCALMGADDSLFDALWDDIDGFSFGDIWAQKAATLLSKLTEDISASVLNGLISELRINSKNASDSAWLDSAISELFT